MNIYENGYIYENTYNEYIGKADKEILLSSLLLLDLSMLYKYFKRETVIPVFRFFVLHDNETVDYEISRDVISANMNITYQSGQRRSINIELANQHGKWNFGASKNLWYGTRFGFDSGVIINNVVYWQKQGVFLLQDFTPALNSSRHTVSLTLCDKWGLWDGSVFGNTELKTRIPTQVPMRQCFNTIVHGINNLGQMWDTKPIRFNTQHWDTLTYYTIKQEADQTIGQVLLDMAQTISSDIYYDTLGYMRVESNVLDCLSSNFPVVWRFDEDDMDCGSPSVKFGRANYSNKIKVKGAMVNGYQFTATVTNNNLESIYNAVTNPIKSKTISNTKLYSDMLCKEQAMYEMVKQSRGMRSVTLPTAFLPFLDVNQAVYLNFPSLDINNETYIIDSISYNIGTDCSMNISLTSDTEVVL